MTERTLAAKRYGIVATTAAIVLSPLLALSYFASSEGHDEPGEVVFPGWIEPATDVAGPLLTFASPETVYALYTAALALMFPAVILGARETRSRRRDVTGTERWGWRLTLGGYTLFGVGLTLVAIALFAVGPESNLTNGLFIGTMVPGLLIGLVGSTVLGIALVRARFKPRLTPWVLTFALPLWFVGSAVLGHNSLGILPLFIAWTSATMNQNGSDPYSSY